MSAFVDQYGQKHWVRCGWRDYGRDMLWGWGCALHLIVLVLAKVGSVAGQACGGILPVAGPVAGAVGGVVQGRMFARFELPPGRVIMRTIRRV